MCGIAGKIDFELKPVDDRLLRSMAQVLEHRGPDDVGVFVDTEAGLAHRRLSILDPTEAGHQPMFSSNGRFAIVYNGEVYNFRELRRELEACGHVFKSHTDTEVVLAAFVQWGPECLNRFNGMFSFAVWDGTERELFLARDRFGIKPLIYYADQEKFLFGSEIKSILMDAGVPRCLDVDALDLYLTWNYVPAPYTIYKGIRKLEPGCYAWVREKTLITKRWYDLSARIPTEPHPDYRAAIRELRRRMTDAVKKRLVSDVPLGAFLSGGIDSTIVVGLMAQQTNEPVRTFTIGFPNEPMFDEGDFASEAARFHHTNHSLINLSYREVLDCIPDVLDTMDEPFADPSALPTFVVSRETRRAVTVALSGDGADESYAGYRKYLGEHFARRFGWATGIVQSSPITALRNRLPETRSTPLGEMNRRFSRFISGLDRDRVRRHYNWMKILSWSEKKTLIKPDILSLIDPDRGLRWVRDLAERGPHDPTNRMLNIDFSVVLPDDMLRKVDSMSMLNSLEVRVPFLDHEVVEWAFSLPGAWKLRGRKRKAVLIDTFNDILPRRLRNRQKQGFDVPIGEWFKRDLRELFWDNLGKPTLEKQGLFDAAAVEDLYNRHAKNLSDNTSKLYNLFVFQWWRNRHEVSLP